MRRRTSPVAHRHRGCGPHADGRLSRRLRAACAHRSWARSRSRRRAQRAGSQAGADRRSTDGLRAAGRARPGARAAGRARRRLAAFGRQHDRQQDVRLGHARGDVRARHAGGRVGRRDRRGRHGEHDQRPVPAAEGARRACAWAMARSSTTCSRRPRRRIRKGPPDGHVRGAMRGVVFGFTREAQDAFAIESLRRAKRANEDGSFKWEIAPVTIQGRKGDR